MVWLFVIFLLVFVIILFSAHWLAYFSLVRFFNLENHNLKLSLAIILAFLSVSFILSSVLSHWKENDVTRAFYLGSNLWLAFFNNLIMALLLAWIIRWIFNALSWSVDFQKIAGVLILLAILVTAWGVWNAFQPRVKNITVKIKNLPVSWQGKTAVQLSDVHLGHVYNANFLKKVVALANSSEPDIVFITGDLFDGMDGELNNLTAPLNDLQAQNIFMVTGNHETYLGTEKAKEALKNNPQIKILDNQVEDVDGLKIVGLSYPGREGMGFKFGEVFGNLKNYNLQDPNILLYHEPRNILEAKELGIKLQLSGHTHKGQTFPFNFITHAMYRGYDYGLFILEDYNLYVTNGIGTWGPPMRIGNRPEIVAIKFE